MATILHVVLVVAVGVLVKIFLFPDGFLGKVPLTSTLNGTYDYIIVGAGSAGCVLANRLSADSDVTVLLLEAGGDDRGVLSVEVPGAHAFSFHSDLDWEYFSDREPGKYGSFGDKRVYIPRGKVLGGSGSINGLQYVRASRHDYDRWAKYTGDPTWDYAHVLPYFLKSEGSLIPGQEHSVYHNTEGPLKVITEKGTTPIMYKIIEAAKELGVKENKDYNGKTMEGISHTQYNVDNGVRVSTAKAFLHPVLTRNNLHVAVHTHVTKVIFEKKRAVGVEVIRNSRKQILRARKEVILSAGAIGSPHILVMSGIGPKDNLQKLGIPVVADLPVGQNLQEHPLIDIPVRIEQPLSLSEDDMKSPLPLIQYKLFGTGPLVSPSQLHGMLFSNTRNKTEKMDWPDIQFHFFDFFPTAMAFKILRIDEKVAEELLEQYSGAKYGFLCCPTLLRPESVGQMTWYSRDPFDNPNITLNLVDHPEDLDILVKGMEFCHKLIETPTLKSVGASSPEKKNFGPCKDLPLKSRENFECQVKNRGFTSFHPVGTAKMGPAGDKTAVVDSQLRVVGVSGLRVVDASIMPWITSGNTNAPVIMVAEKTADVIRQREPLAPIRNA